MRSQAKSLMAPYYTNSIDFLSLCGSALSACVRVESVELVGIDAAHHPRREQPLEEAADATGALPGRRDLDTAAIPGRIDRPGSDQTGLGVRLGQHPARLGLGDLHVVLAGAATGRDLETGDGPRSDAAALDLEVGEGRRK